VAAEPISSGRERPLTVEDLLRLEELGEVALSPDGRWLAFVLKRPRLTAKFHKYDFLDGGDRADGGELVVLAGNEQDLVLGARVERQGEGHAGEDDYVVEGNQGKRAHGWVLSAWIARIEGYHQWL